MEKVQNFEKKEFIITECMLFSVQAGLQTRNKSFPIYNDKPFLFTNNKELKSQPDNTSNLKWFIFDFLGQYLDEIKNNGIDESVHLFKIKELAEITSKEFKPILHDSRFRIGISQKIINLFLKYMWSMNEIPEPCHCPIDGIIKSQINKEFSNLNLVDWTRLDCMIEYQRYVDVVKQIAAKYNQSIAVWEFVKWGRRY